MRYEKKLRGRFYLLGLLRSGRGKDLRGVEDPRLLSFSVFVLPGP